MEINTRFLKLKGTIETTESPNRDTYTILAGEFEATDVNYKPNQDGTYDEVTSLIPVRIMQQKEGVERLKLKTKSKASVRLRGALWHKHRELNLEGDFEDWYENQITKIIINLEAILNLPEN